MEDHATTEWRTLASLDRDERKAVWVFYGPVLLKKMAKIQTACSNLAEKIPERLVNQPRDISHETQETTKAPVPLPDAVIAKIRRIPVASTLSDFLGILQPHVSWSTEDSVSPLELEDFGMGYATPI